MLVTDGPRSPTRKNAPLACEARPRMTAMRHRAMEILQEELGLGYISASEDPALREIAARLRETHRKRR